MTPTASACRKWYSEHCEPTYSEYDPGVYSRSFDKEVAALTVFVEERELMAKIEAIKESDAVHCVDDYEQLVAEKVRYETRLAARQQGEEKQ